MNNSVCKLAWTGMTILDVGHTKPCCIFKEPNRDKFGNIMLVQNSSLGEIFHCESMVTLRNELRAGSRPSGCSECWADEDRGHVSKRQFYLAQHPTDEDIDWASEPTTVSFLQVSIDNTCNLKCRSCSPSHSSKWSAEATLVNRKLNTTLMPIHEYPHKSTGDDTSRFWLDRASWINDVRYLEMIGGEPLFSKKWRQILFEIADSPHASQVDVSVCTNAFLYYENIAEELGPRFRTLTLAMSIDGTGTVFEYLRHPAKWDIVIDNVTKYNELHKIHNNILVMVTATLSWLNGLNVHALYNLMATFPDQGFWFNLVRGPAHMALWAIPDNLKEAIDENLQKIDHPDINGIRKFMFSQSITDAQFLDNLRILRVSDIIRNEDLLEMIPALTPYIGEYWDIIKGEINEI